MTVNDYVIVVHGTFNAPSAGIIKWYQPKSTDELQFCNQLEARLEQFGLGGAVWRSVNFEPPFFWSGLNTHTARVEAAKKLAISFDNIKNHDKNARIHVVAHSHGGSVLLKAVEIYMERAGAQAKKFLYHFDEAAKNSSDMYKIEDIIDGLPFGVSSENISSKLIFDLKMRHLYMRRYRNKKSILEISNYSAWSLFKVFLPIEYLREQRILFELFEIFESGDQTLGRLVFLGTPFFRKIWSGHASHYREKIDMIVRALISLPFLGGYIYRNNNYFSTVFLYNSNDSQ